MERLLDFLVEESVIKTKLGKASDWIPNVAHKVYFEENEIVIALDERYLSSLVMVGDDMQVTQTLEGYEYILNCIITQISIEPKRIILLRVNDFKKIQILRGVNLTKC